uniref:RES family NAD+ phosphorylase n=1 Tax=Bordetella sputigena TaxID=1416810 RepID=UPI0039F0CA4B
MTVTLWRIATDAPSYTADDMQGLGAKKTGGRWNRQGTPMIYTATSRSLACLETMVHLGAITLPLNRYLVEINVPDKLWDTRKELDVTKNIGWDAIPPGRVSLDAGDEWCRKNSSPLMCVPSVIVPEELNVLINPTHPAAADITSRKVRKWVYDLRVWAKL